MHVGCPLLFRLVAIITASLLLGSGCTSMHRVAVVTTPETTTVKTGDDVRVTMRDGRTAEFTVALVDASTITADGGEKYETDQILTLERRTFSAAKTTVLIVGVAGAVGVAYVILYAIAFASLWGAASGG